ncbi:MAG: hypothetical protein U0235_33175 [Polyangiaceae bacterium]
MRLNAILGLTILSTSLAAWSAACSSDDSTPATPAGTDASTSDVTTTPSDSGGGTTDTGTTADTGTDANEVFNCDDAGIDAPQSLKCTGLYSSFTNKTIAAGVKEYAPAVKLWSDGAQKTRWVYLPPGEKIDTTDMDEWKYPVGTKFWKEFVVDGKRVETRFFWKVSSSIWTRTTYKWNAAQDDAIRLDSGEWGGALDAGPDGGPGDAAAYEIPSVAKCDQCHNGRIDKILGFEAVGLGLPGATGVTLASLVSDSLLTTNPPATTLAIPEDSTGKAAAAIGYLHANCGTACHNTSPAHTCPVNMVLRLGYADLHPTDGGTATVANLATYTSTVGVNAGTVGLSPDGGTYKRIAPHDVTGSAISYLAGRREGYIPNKQMPPIDTHVVDTVGVGQINDWVNALP